MAGIGFRLQKLLNDGSYSSSMKAYFFSALIMAGPLLLTIMTLSFLNWISIENLTPLEQAYLRSLVTYCYAFSLISVGPFYLIITRFLADEYYRKHVSHYTAAFFSAITVVSLIAGPLVLVYLSQLSVSWTVKIDALLLFLFVQGTWMALLFLSAARDYMKPVRAFLVGSIVGILAAWGLGRQNGFDGYFSGFVLGQGTTFLILSLAIIKEFGYQEPRDYFWLGYFKRYPLLVGIGFFYNLGIWADKILFWGSHESEPLDTFLRYCPIYDGPMFFAFLTTLPTLAYFLVRMETEFFFKYHDYFGAIQNRHPLDELEKRRVNMIHSLEESIRTLIIVQSIVSGMAILLVPWITVLTRMDPLHMSIFRIGILGSFLQVGFLIMLNLLFYFDAQKEALMSTFLFCFCNFLFTFISLNFGLKAYGFGYAGACFVALACAFFYLNNRLKWLHFWTFMKQPLFQPIQVSSDETE